MFFRKRKPVMRRTEIRRGSFRLDPENARNRRKNPTPRIEGCEQEATEATERHVRNAKAVAPFSCFLCYLRFLLFLQTADPELRTGLMH